MIGCPYIVTTVGDRPYYCHRTIEGDTGYCRLHQPPTLAFWDRNPFVQFILEFFTREKKR